MIQITEENIENGINIGLGSLGIWTPKLSEYLLNEILALQQPPVSVNEVAVCSCKHQHKHLESRTVRVCSDCGKLLS